tara:strand:- start:28 stop:831 length:804 start_codon:yes stop_codon:yes gene_type:complete
MTQEIRLGQRVYGVTGDGTIIPTLISRIELPETNEGESDFVRRGSEMLNGRLHESVPGIQFRALNHNLDQVWLTFDEACDKAVEVLERLKGDESVSVRDQRAYTARYERLVTEKEAEREVVDGVEMFTESDTMIGRMFDRDEKDRRFRASDFPQHYIELGTPVWIADTKTWNLIQGFVTQVDFAPRWQRNHLYYCGSHSNLRADRVFRTKKGALNCLEREFAAALPGTLDRRRVPVVQQISNAEQHKQRLEMFRGMSVRGLKAREPA